jgi:hypothetical protein
MAWALERKGCAAALALVALACGGGSDDHRDTAAPNAAAEPHAERPKDSNLAPVIQSVRFEPDEPAGGEPLRAVVGAADPDGDTVQLSFAWAANDQPLAGNGPAVKLPALARGSRIEVTVTASDGRAKSEPVRAEVELRNRPPVVTAVKVDPAREVSKGEPVKAVADARDPDGDAVELRYDWTVNDRPVEATGNSLATSELHKGDAIRVWAVAADGEDESDAVPSGVVTVANGAPVILSSPSGMSGDGSFRYVIQARDPDGDRNLRFSLRKGPPGMQVNPVLGEVTWKAARGQDGKFPVELVVEDSDGATATQAFELTVDTEATAKAAPAPAGRHRRPAPTPAAPAPAPEE